MIKEKLEFLLKRPKAEKYIKYAENFNKSRLVQNKKEKLYEYYRCDYCGGEIRITKKLEDRDGGLVTFPLSLTMKGRLNLALHDRCLNPAKREFENYKGERNYEREPKR